MTARTRNATDKIFGKEQFAPIEKLPLGKLPTLKEVIGRCLTFKDYKTDEIIKAEKNYTIHGSHTMSTLFWVMVFINN